MQTNLKVWKVPQNNQHSENGENGWKIIKRQAEYDAEFMQQLKESSEENDFEFSLKDSDQHKIDEEIKRLEKLLQKASQKNLLIKKIYKKKY